MLPPYLYVVSHEMDIKSGLSQPVYLILKFAQKSSRMGAVHLRVVELERDGQIVSEEPLLVFAPDDKRVIEYAAVHANGAVDLSVDYCGCADDHAVFGQIPVSAAFRDICGKFKIFPIEYSQSSE